MRSHVALVLSAAMLAAQISAVASPPVSPRLQSATTLLEQMTPEERVGQLFILTFKGSTLRSDDPIRELIRDYHVSGFLLQAKNDNFAAAPNTLTATRNLISDLQAVEYEGSLSAKPGDPTQGEPSYPAYIPLFIGLEQEGGGAPFDQILSGVSELPSEMAIGATWDPLLAREAGRIMGSELEALGFNLLLGPSLDVLEDPRLGGPGDLGVRSFGGDPYWVSLLGRAYVTGLHEGSSGRVSVIAKHFPGHGSSDRPLNEEVATVRKSLDQLTQIELAPFFSVTDAVPGAESHIIDGLLAAHIRYQGLQGNIRATTRPITLDPGAFSLLMSLDPLNVWHEGGGVVMSDSLGSRSLRRFIDPSERTFRSHLVARDAFLAGNDLLMISDFQSSEDPDEITTIKSTLGFFAQKYREDPVFAQRVDDSVLRILEMKLRLYGGEFLPDRVQPDEQSLGQLPLNQEFAFRVARRGATLITPSREELEERLSGPPAFGERVVFFTDVRMTRQCTSCEAVPIIDRRALEDSIVALYGPRAAGQVGTWSLTSFTMADLASYLGETPPSNLFTLPLPAEDLDEPLRTADWLVFVTLDSTADVFGSDALRLLLDRRPDLAREKRLVVFAHDVPYDLDATEISKIDVFYALYSSTPAFVDVAARLLFQELSAPGSPPVSVPGIGYDLLQATLPDPNQVISLSVQPAGQAQGTPTTEGSGFLVGDLVALRTGVILDRNGNHVPDNTPVEFVLSYQGETTLPQELEAFTVDGVAETTLTLAQFGELTIRAQSGLARTSQLLQLNVQEGVQAFPTVIVPSPEPSDTPQPSPTSVPPSPTVTLTPEGEPEDLPAGQGRNWGELLAGMIGLAGVLGGGYWSSRNGGQTQRGRARLLWVLAVSGLAGYNYFAFDLPGSLWLTGWAGAFGGLFSVGLGGLLGYGAVWLWKSRLEELVQTARGRGERAKR